MSDSRVRDLERRWKQTGTVNDEAAYAAERIRIGEEGVLEGFLDAHDWDEIRSVKSVFGSKIKEMVEGWISRGYENVVVRRPVPTWRQNLYQDGSMELRVDWEAIILIAQALDFAGVENPLAEIEANVDVSDPNIIKDNVLVGLAESALVKNDYDLARVRFDDALKKCSVRAYGYEVCNRCCSEAGRQGRYELGAELIEKYTEYRRVIEPTMERPAHLPSEEDQVRRVLYRNMLMGAVLRGELDKVRELADEFLEEGDYDINQHDREPGLIDSPDISGCVKEASETYVGFALLAREFNKRFYLE